MISCMSAGCPHTLQPGWRGHTPGQLNLVPGLAGSMSPHLLFADCTGNMHQKARPHQLGKLLLWLHTVLPDQAARNAPRCSTCAARWSSLRPRWDCRPSCPCSH